MRKGLKRLERNPPDRWEGLCKGPEVEGCPVCQEQQEASGESSGVTEWTSWRQGQTVKEKRAQVFGSVYSLYGIVKNLSIGPDEMEFE